MNPAQATPATVVAPRRKAAGITPVAWVVNAEMDLADWVAAGRNLGAMSRCSQWWLGDWIRYGNTKFGERYARVASITGYDAQTLMNMVYVASRFDISRRRENLSWSHHEALASLDEHAQEHWLDYASGSKLSVSDLRLELRAARKRSRQENEDRTTQEGDKRYEADALVCPRCGEKILV
jgi:hypothetical protein